MRQLDIYERVIYPGRLVFIISSIHLFLTTSLIAILSQHLLYVHLHL